jgi:hypothetical protein
MSETYSDMMHRKMTEYERNKNAPIKPHTTCRNTECPHHARCTHNVYIDGPVCVHASEGCHYRSQQQAIYADYVADCERKGTEPMNRFHYFEF